MLTEDQTAWLKALRSGEYKQAQEYLTVDGVGSCCLGVLCEVKKLPHIVSKEGGINTYYYTFPNGIQLDKTLPEDFAEEMGLNKLVPKWYSGGEGGEGFREYKIELANNLMLMNDSGKTFEQIADYIEEQLNAD